MTGEAASADWERANDFPDAIKKLIDEKGYLLEQIFNADENALVLKKKCHKGLLWVRKRSTHQD